MDGKKSKAVRELEYILGYTNVISDKEVLKKMLDNTLGVVRQVEAVVYPSSTEDVRKIIEIANRYLIPLYPVSRGKNIGYGNMAPVGDGHIIVDLRKMNSIYEFDNIHGSIYVQPGVSQQQLNNFLESHDSKFWMDATGAGLDASIIGNSLDGGFGHTPKGNRRKTISDLEVVLGNGTVLKTGIFPGLGPDLSGIFIQSNFGIVTGMKLELIPIPKHYESFLIKTKHDEELESLVDVVSELRRQNILTSLVHIANATRSLISTRPCPNGYEDKILTCEDAIKIMSTPLVKVGYWTAIGGIYGTKQEVMIKKKEIKRNLKFADMEFISDIRLITLSKIIDHRFMPSRLRDSLKDSIATLKYIHNLGKGMPSNKAFDNIKWRVEDYKDMGLIWYSPTLPANGNDARRIIKIAKVLFEEYGFELPITMTLISPDKIVGIISINFNKNKSDQREKACNLYNSLNREGIKEGIHSYRKPIIGMEIKYDEGKMKVLKNLKDSLDPNGIISPGRYGI